MGDSKGTLTAAHVEIFIQLREPLIPVSLGLVQGNCGQRWLRDPQIVLRRKDDLQSPHSETVWLAGAGNPTPVFNGSPGGLELGPGASVTTSVSVPWGAGRYWGRRNCVFDSSGHGTCATGDCGGVLQCTHAGAGTTLAEFTLTGSSTGSDNYDISLVDAFDFPISIQLDDPNPNHCINPPARPICAFSVPRKCKLKMRRET